MGLTLIGCRMRMAKYLHRLPLPDLRRVGLV
jgi:hypothetical protein